MPTRVPHQRLAHDGPQPVQESEGSESYQVIIMTVIVLITDTHFTLMILKWTWIMMTMTKDWMITCDYNQSKFECWGSLKMLWWWLRWFDGTGPDGWGPSERKIIRKCHFHFLMWWGSDVMFWKFNFHFQTVQVSWGYQEHSQRPSSPCPWSSKLLLPGQSPSSSSQSSTSP